MAKKLTKEEFSKYQSLSRRYRMLQSQVAEASIKLHQLNSMYPAVAGELNNFNNELVEKYGEGEINPETGELTPIMSKVEESDN
jgi:hypothetical protein